MFVFDDLIDRDLQKDAAAVAERLVYFHNKTPVKGLLPIEQEANAQPWQGESDLPEIDAAAATESDTGTRVRCDALMRGCVSSKTVFLQSEKA